MKKITLKIILIIFVFALSLTAQSEPDTSPTVQSNDTSYVMTKSPWGAVGRSAILPGWGQYYNESYWKIPVFWGFLGWFGYNYILNNKEYKKYRDLYDESLEDSDLGDPNYKAYRNFYQDQRDEWAVWFLLTYLLNLVDAYVDAHLFDFDVTENPYYKSPQINIRLNLN